jgi:hypothetical protein
LTDIENMIRLVEGRQFALDKVGQLFVNRLGFALVDVDEQSDLSSDGFTIRQEGINSEGNQNFLDEIYCKSIEEYKSIIDEFDFRSSDIDIMIDLFILFDKSLSNSIDIRIVSIALSLIISTTVEECLNFCFQLYDRQQRNLLSKKSMMDVFLAINETFLYFNDHYLSSKQIHDLTDSVFTSAGNVRSSAFPLNLRSLVKAIVRFRYKNLR